MRYSFLSAALFAASTLAAPIAKIVYDVDVVTVVDVITVTGGYPKPTKASGEFIQYSAPPVYTPPAPTPAPVYVPAPSASPAPVAAPPSSYDDGSPMSGGKSILSVINKYRSKYGMKDIAWDDKLVGNAQKTTDDNHGVTEKHELNSGSSGQCLTPGFNEDTASLNTHGATPFEMAYLSWMCEKSTDRELSAAENDGVDICAMVSGPDSVMHMSLGGEIGHYLILTSPDYKTIGCAFTPNPHSSQPEWTGLWGCDLGRQ